MIELTAPVVKNNSKHIVYGTVLVPNEPDHDGDKVTEKIQVPIGTRATHKPVYHNITNLKRYKRESLDIFGLTYTLYKNPL